MLGRVSLQLATAQPAACASLVRRGLLACDSDMDQVLRDVVVKSQQHTAHTMLALMGLDGVESSAGGSDGHDDLVSRMEALSMGQDADFESEGQQQQQQQQRVAQMMHSLLTAAVRVDPGEADAWRQLANFHAEHVPEPVYLATSPSARVDADQAVELAVRSYARYLDLAMSMADKHRANMAAMRLLHLIELHAETLAHQVDPTQIASVTSGNAHTWTFLMPQLTAMLVHPHPFPSTFASAIIKQLVQHAPAACVYPLVALDLERPELQIDSRLLGTVESRDMVQATRVLVEHAQRLTVLWDEQWHHSLTSLQGAVLRRSMSVPAMIAELERLAESHLKYPVSAHELAFQTAFMRKIEAAVAGVKAVWAKVSGGSGSGSSGVAVDLDLLGPEKWRGVVKQVWKPLHPLVVALNNVVNRGRNLELEHVGALHGLDLSAGCLPGTSTRIAGIAPGFLVLPTKTKPKKITFIAEDGSAHAYLLKGLEDLRLDERMVQVFETVNHMLTDAAGRGGNRDAAALLRLTGPSSAVVRGYSVVPLGHMGGFIQWVSAVPIYSIYKRQYLAMHANQSPPKPLAAFNAAAHKVLGLSGAVPVSSLRKHCSDDQLVDIYKALCNSERNDGIRNTLYLATTSSWSAIQMQRRFAHSVAATSMVGHVLGLGDRHLDNVLLDVANGQVVHIDYNVSFDRGSALRIPELVPFRLTRSFVAAMGGDVGVRGPFLAAAEVVLGLLRKHRAYVVQLLESMVMDEHANWDVVAGLGSGAAPAADDDGEANAGAGGDEDGDVEEVEDDEDEEVTDTSVSGPVSQELGSQCADAPSSDGVGSGSEVDQAAGVAGHRRKVTGEGQALDDEKREQAVRVLRNVMSKLEGGQLAGGVSKHVSELVDAAMDEGRLSQMFEGWTPWI
ncbi:hypothetical protein BCR44DRAFT_1219905 [Catenaria anguillulae PL171]|uniref:non-specific serine/threonine protein kinase n=1 Tax=Catenaria anguillulae PL171 TaxID=765915 RepID=A0A1Y2I1B8_9FUNG|nr:hypothetical protein BCR44DRAFT_1219905 [Catenaria anguillulae PL171]